MNIELNNEKACNTFTSLESALKTVSIKCPCNNCSLDWRDDKNCWECNYNKKQITYTNFCSIDTIPVQ